MNNPYVEISRQAFEIAPYYGDMIVRIRLDGKLYNEVLCYDAANDCGEWLNDWYEGQKEVIFVGAIPVDRVVVPHKYYPKEDRYEAI